MMHCIIQIVMAIQKYLLQNRHFRDLMIGTLLTFLRASMTTVSLHCVKQSISRMKASTAQMLMTLIQASWLSPSTLMSGRVAEMEMILPIGESAIRVMESISRSREMRVIIAERLP